MDLLESSQIIQALDALSGVPSDSDISGIADDSDKDETFRPRGEEVVSSSEEEEEEDGVVEEVQEVPDPLQEVHVPRQEVPGPHRQRPGPQQPNGGRAGGSSSGSGWRTTYQHRRCLPAAPSLRGWKNAGKT